MDGKMSFNVTVNSDKLASRAMEEIYLVFVDGWVDAVDEFQQNTPIGATGDLKAGWDIDEFYLNASQRGVKISNNAEKALYRIAGRGPGKRPPYDSIFPWTVKKGIPEKTFAIMNVIAKRGTHRWIKKDNWVGINNDGSLIDNGRILQIVKEIEKDLKNKFS